MFGKTVLSTIISNVFREAELTAETIDLVKSKNEVAAVYTALVSFFLSSHEMEGDFALGLTPVFQRKLAGNVPEAELKECTDLIGKSYARFCEKGVRLPYNVSEWQEELFVDYVDIIIELIEIQSNEFNKNYILSTVIRLFKIAAKDYSKEGSLIKPSTDVALAQLAVFCVLYFIAWKVKGIFAPSINDFLESVNSEQLGVVLFLFYYIGIPLAIAFCVSKAYILIFRKYLIGLRTGITMMLVVWTHMIIDTFKTYNDRHESIYILFGIWFFACLIAYFIYFLKPRCEKS